MEAVIWQTVAFNFMCTILFLGKRRGGRESKRERGHRREGEIERERLRLRFLFWFCDKLCILESGLDVFTIGSGLGIFCGLYNAYKIL